MKPKSTKIKLPVFLLIAIVVMTIMASLVYYIFLNFTPTGIIPYSGYGISSMQLAENLSQKDVEPEQRVIKAVAVNEQEMLFKKLNGYFVQDKDKNINIEYPIFINNNKAILNLSDNIVLITDTFEEVPGYSNLTLTNGELYNEADLKRADTNNYILLRNIDNMYINSVEINIKTALNQYTIPMNTIINFTENNITMYQIEGEYFVHSKIADIDNDSIVSINNDTYTYREFLIKIGKIREKITREEIIKEKVDTNETVTDSGNQDVIEEEAIYIKPEVICNELTAKVYTIQVNLTIKDPRGRIITPPTFEFIINGRTYLRRSITEAGDSTILRFTPDETYTVIGKYVYLNEQEQKIESTFIEQKVTMGSTDTLNPIALTFKNGKIYSDKIELVNFGITSSIQDEAIYGIKNAEIIMNNIIYKIPMEKLSSILRAERVTIDTKDGLKSNSIINYEVVFYDIAGNKMKLENNKGVTKTSKQEPKVIATIRKQDPIEMTIGFKLDNKDNAANWNYRYEIIDLLGNVAGSGALVESQTQLILGNLNPNQFYTLKFYLSYDLDNGMGAKENVVIGEISFVTVPLSTLGHFDMNAEIIERTSDLVDIELEINLQRTDVRLVQLLDKMSASIYEEKAGGILVFAGEIILTNQEIQDLKLNQKVNVQFGNLKSNTKYIFEIGAIVKQGDIETSIEVVKRLHDFTTLKKVPEVQIRQLFVTEEMIDFDVRIEDPDGAILNGEVRLEVRDERNRLVSLSNIEVNQDYIRLTYERLEKEKNYKISFYANDYNLDNIDATYKSNVLLYEFTIYTQVGISGTLELMNSIRKETGKNLCDVKSEIKWYSPCFATDLIYDKTYDEQTNILKLSVGPNATHYRYYTYDLTNYIGKTVTISFLAQIDGNTAGAVNAYLQASKTGGTRTLLTGLNATSWVEYTQTFTVDSTGYLGFYIQSTIAGTQSLLIKDLQIESGSVRTAYQPYQYNLETNFRINLQDFRYEIETGDYYLWIYQNGTLIAEDRYVELGENHKVIDSIKKYNLAEGKTYQVDLVIKIRERYYVISSMDFATNHGEILGISTRDEFLAIQPKGNYVVLKDIDLSGLTGVYRRFGYNVAAVNLGFKGKIDFRGHSLKINTTSTSSVFDKIDSDGVIENIVIDVVLDNAVEMPTYYGFVNRHYGKISNVIINLLECEQKPNVNVCLLGYYNYGITENFIINFEKSLYGARYLSGGFYCNYGTIRNGYIYGENIQAPFTIPSSQERGIAPLVIFSEAGTIENVYSLTNVNYDKNSGTGVYTANLVDYNNGIIRNVYSVGIGDVNLAYGPTVARNVGTGRTYNTYYFCDGVVFTNNYNTTTTKLALHDTEFHNNILNSHNQFFVNDLITQKYFPHVKFNSIMPHQEYIPLPTIKDEDLVDIISIEVLEAEHDNMKVGFWVHNPSGETIVDINVRYLTVNILSQEYAEGKSYVIAHLSNPAQYLSQYSVMGITSKGTYNLPYTRNFVAGERLIFVDFYKGIYNIPDWKNMNNAPSENHRLMVDLNFINELTGVAITNNFSGKFDGNNHTVKNIVIGISSTAGLFGAITGGEVRNLFVENFYWEVQGGTGDLGVIRRIDGGGVIDNVHVTGAKFYYNRGLNCYVGGIAGYAR